MKLYLTFILFFLVLIFCTACQQRSKVSPQHFMVDVTEFPDNTLTPDKRYRIEQEWSEDASNIILIDTKSGSKNIISKEGAYSYNPLLSPNGKMVAYVRDSGSITELRVAATDLSGSHVVYSKKAGSQIRIHEWSPNNKYVAATVINSQDKSFTMIISYVSDHSSQIIKEQTFGSINFNFQYNRMSFSADSRFIAYDLCPASAWYPRDIFAMPISGGKEFTLVQNNANDLLLSYSPDMQHVLFASDRSGKWDLWILPINKDGEPSGPAKLAMNNIGNTINGNDIFFTNAGFTSDSSFYYRKSSASTQLYLATLDTVKKAIQNQKIVSNHAGFNISPQWSRNGKYLIYGWGLGYEYDPLILGIRSFKDGTERTLRLNKLMRHGGHGFEPQWSPDGTHLLVTARQRDYSGPGMDSQGLYIIDIENGDATPFVLTDGICGLNCIMTPLWLTNGQAIFQRRLSESIVLRNIKTGNEKTLFNRDTTGLMIRIWPGSNLAVSPDNKKLAFVLTNWRLGVSKLMVVSLEGGTPYELLEVRNRESITNPTWMSNSSDIIYSRNYSGGSSSFELFTISSNSGLNSSLGLKMSEVRITGLSIHPDGKHIAFTTDKISDETWVIKNLLLSQISN